MRHLRQQLEQAHSARRQQAEVVRKYESGSVYLIDSAQFLIRGCTYELPALRQESGRAEKELAELRRRDLATEGLQRDRTASLHEAELFGQQLHEAHAELRACGERCALS